MEPSDLEIFNLNKRKESTIIRLELAVSGSQVKWLDERKERCEREKTSKVSQLTESLEQTSVTNAVNSAIVTSPFISVYF